MPHSPCFSQFSPFSFSLRVEDLAARQAQQACPETQVTLESKAPLVPQGFQAFQVTQGILDLLGPRVP